MKDSAKASAGQWYRSVGYFCLRGQPAGYDYWNANRMES